MYGVRGVVEGSTKALNFTKSSNDEPQNLVDSTWKTSELYYALRAAIENVTFYTEYAPDPLNNPENFMVAANEYTYLLNFSMWGMGKEFWSDKNESGHGFLEGEWSETASTSEGVMPVNSLGYALFNKYFAPVLSKPDFITLRTMFKDNDGGVSGYQPDPIPAQVFFGFSSEEHTVEFRDYRC